jgi:hypothetical protein
MRSAPVLAPAGAVLKGRRQSIVGLDEAGDDFRAADRRPCSGAARLERRLWRQCGPIFSKFYQARRGARR